MASKRERNPHLQEFQPPEKKLVTEGDKLIKKLSEKQLNKKITLAGQLSQEKQFERSTEYLPITSLQSGECSVQKLQDVVTHSKYLEDLKAAGLCNEDIQLYIDYDGNFEAFSKRHRFYQSNLLRERINEIERIITAYKEKTKNINNETKNTDKEIDALKEKPESLETKLLKFAMGNKHKEKLPHPMDELNDIKADLEERVKFTITDTDINQIRRKARKLGNRLLNDKNKPSTSKTESKLSKWDVKERNMEDLTAPKPTIVEKKLYSCNKKQNLYTISNGEIVALNELENFQCDGSKMSEAEIKKLPRFGNYTQGEVGGNVLYVRNLPGKITEKILLRFIRSYGEINDDGVVVKVLGGRMKGQAFITFDNPTAAIVNMEKLNGLLINGKPMVIEFGKKR